MNTTREQAIDLLTEAILKRDHETADLFFRYIAWLDGRKPVDR